MPHRQMVTHCAAPKRDIDVRVSNAVQQQSKQCVSFLEEKEKGETIQRIGKERERERKTWLHIH